MGNDGYHIIDPDEVTNQPERPPIEPKPDPLAETYSISAEANFAILGIRTYSAEPGEQLPLAYHYHEEQEEAFYALEGVLHVETPVRDYTVEPGKFFMVEGGNPHRAFVPSDAPRPVRVVAVGAPSDDTGLIYEEDD
jgi:quercetin dioxygenase-like cupin family protein